MARGAPPLHRQAHAHTSTPLPSPPSTTVNGAKVWQGTQYGTAANSKGRRDTGTADAAELAAELDPSVSCEENHTRVWVDSVYSLPALPVVSLNTCPHCSPLLSLSNPPL